MATTLNAGTTTGTSLQITTDTTGAMNIQTSGANAISISSSQAVTLANPLPAGSGGTGVTSLGTGVATALGQNVTGSGSIVLAASPTLTGVPLAPTATTGTNTTQVATTAFVQASTTALNLGTISTQNANSVAITGGTINGTPIGASTAAVITGTTITGTTITASSQFTGPGTGLTGTASSLTSGVATVANNAVGYNQTWQDVTGSRALSTTYTNSTGRPIQIYFTASGSASTTVGTGFTLLLNGTLSFNDGFTTGASSCAIQIVIPAGATYYISQTSGTTYSGYTWLELR